MICSNCNIHIPTYRTAYCCIDKIFCSLVCSNKKLFIIKKNDPEFTNPHDWNNILNSSNNNKFLDLLENENENENEFECIINIKKQKSKNNLLLHIDNSNEYIHSQLKKRNKIKFKLNGIRNYLSENIICKYKLHIISIIIYGFIVYEIYNLLK